MPGRTDGAETVGYPLESAIWALAANQHGVITRAQLLKAGIAAHVIDRRLKMGRLRPMHRGVYLVGPLRVRRTDEMAAVLACGGAVVVSHRSAGVMWELLAPDDRAVLEVTYPADEGLVSPRVPPPSADAPRPAPGARPSGSARHPHADPMRRGSRAAAERDGMCRGSRAAADRDVMRRGSHFPGSRDGIRVHRSLTLRAEDVTVRDGIPVTTVARTLYDLARTGPGPDVERALASALDAQLTDAAALGAWLDRCARYAGAPRLRALLGANEPPSVVRSTAEARFLALVRRAQLPEPQTNVRVRGFEVDFYWRTERFVVEMDGFAFHASARMFESDRRRDAVLMSAGIRVMRVTWKQLENEPEAMLVRLARALNRGDSG